jgi:hypothetical protein
MTKVIFSLTLFALATSAPSAAQTLYSRSLPAASLSVGALPLAAPISRAATAANVVVAGPVFATYASAGLPCLNCVVPTGGKTMESYTFGSYEPIGTLPTSATTISYVLYFTNLSCPAAAKGSTNIKYEFSLWEGSTHLDYSIATANIAAPSVNAASFNRSRPTKAVTGFGTIYGSVTCTTATTPTQNVVAVPIYFE